MKYLKDWKTKLRIASYDQLGILAVIQWILLIMLIYAFSGGF